MADDIPWREELNLKNLINAPAIVKTVEWKAVGLQLGVEWYVLEKIEREQNCRIDDCMTETLNYWLHNGHLLSWAEVNRAVKTVEERKEERICQQEVCRASIEEEKSAAVKVVTQLQTSLDELSVTDGEIVHEQSRLAEELANQKKIWESIQARWNEEDREWKRKAESRRQVKDALKDTDIEARWSWYQEIAARSRELRFCHEGVQTCYKELQQLLNETSKWNKLVEERIQVCRSILDELKHLGLKQEKLDTLESQIKQLTSTLREFKLENEKCDTAVREGIEYLRERRNQSRVFMISLDNTCKEMQQELKGLQHDIDQMEQDILSLNGAPITGAIVGGVVGSVVPVAGTVAGAAVGYVAGHVWMSASQKEELSKLQERLANKKRMIRNLQETEEHAKQELNELGKLIQFHCM